MKIAINGFGRIGRMAYRVLQERGLDKYVIAVNDLTDAPTLAHLLQYDSNYGKFKATVKSHVYDNQAPYTGALMVDDHSFYVLSVKEPDQLPWKQLGVDIVIESTGRFTDPEGMKKHIAAGAKRVVLSAPVEGEGVTTVVIGVNDEVIDGSTELFANASCTTNCITPVAAVILKEFGIQKAMMTTVHSFTADQVLQDGPHKDLRRARSAPQNIVPTTTGATKAAAKAVPQLEGIFSGLSLRVPTPVGSISDFTFLTDKDTTVEAVNAALKSGSEGKYKGILEYTELPLVSSDIVGNKASAIIDASLTQVVGGNMVKVVAWYDNEWGYSNRLIDEVMAIAKVMDSGAKKDTLEHSETPKLDAADLKTAEAASSASKDSNGMPSLYDESGKEFHEVDPTAPKAENPVPKVFVPEPLKQPEPAPKEDDA